MEWHKPGWQALKDGQGPPNELRLHNTKCLFFGAILTTYYLLSACGGAILHDVPLTPLCGAASEGNIHLTNKLIRSGEDVNEADSNGLTPLAWAARGNGAAVVPILVKAGADINRRSRGWTPLMHAIDFQHVTVAEQLLASGANVNERGEKDGYTALMLAIKLGHQEFVPLFLDHGADPHITAPDGADALTLALAGGSPHNDLPLTYCRTSLVRQLMQRYPDLTIPNTPWGEHALQQERQGYCEEILSMVHRSQNP